MKRFLEKHKKQKWWALLVFTVIVALILVRVFGWEFKPEFPVPFGKVTPPSQENQAKMSGVLQPASDPIPPSPCPPTEAFKVYLGNSVAYARQFPYTILQIGGENLISLDKNANEIYLSAKIFSADHRIVAEIKKNQFYVNPNNYFRMEQPDNHTLIVYDQQARQVLNVRYLNSSSIRLLGIFYFPNYKPIMIEEKQLVMDIGTISESCLGGSGGALAF